MASENSRSKTGVVCCLIDGDGDHLRLVFDDVDNAGESTSAVWKHRVLFTWNDYRRADVEAMKLSDKQLAEVGFNLLARLVSLRDPSAHK